MKITAFNPMILTKNAEALIEMFEAMGFERRHNKEKETFNSVSMKNADGFRVDVVQVEQIPQDMVSIRMSVNSIEEACEYLASQGFVNVNGDNITDTGSSKATMMTSPSGISISVSQHIKE